MRPTILILTSERNPDVIDPLETQIRATDRLTEVQKKGGVIAHAALFVSPVRPPQTL